MATGKDGTELHISATKFKATCLELMDRVKRTRGTIVITKHGKPVARLVPPDEDVPGIFGWMAGTGRIVGDIISAMDVRWEAMEDDDLG